MTQPLVSVVMPLFNGADFVKESIESVIKQQYQNWELLVVDDCSTDNSVEIIKSIAGSEPRVKLVHLNHNSGPAVARNTAIEHAQGRFIAFLDSDDIWSAQKLEIQVHYMLTHKHAFTYTNYHLIDEQGNNHGLAKSIPDSISYKDLLKTCYIGCLTAMYDTDMVGKIFMPLIRKRQDYALWLKILKKTERAYLVPDVLGEYRLRQNSVSSNKLKLVKYNWNLFYRVEQLSLMRSVYYLSCNIYFKVFR